MCVCVGVRSCVRVCVCVCVCVIQGNDFYSSDQAGDSPFADPSGRNPIYQGTGNELDAAAAADFGVRYVCTGASCCRAALCG